MRVVPSLTTPLSLVKHALQRHGFGFNAHWPAGGLTIATAKPSVVTRASTSAIAKLWAKLWPNTKLHARSPMISPPATTLTTPLTTVS